MKTKSVKSPINAEVLTRRVFGGELLLFDSLSATRRLVQKARRIARHCFDMQNPTHAHRRFAGKDFFERAAAAQKEFNTLAYRAIFADCLTEIGLSTNGLFRDTLGLRIAPPVKTHEGGFRSNVAVHRDTWGSGLQAQINWWLPAWPLAKERTMGFYPAHWLKPIANTTAQWSFKGFLASRKKAAPGKAAAYHSAPRALEAPDGEVSPVLPPVGSMLVFSSAHLHASIPNHTALTRFSIEIRTVALDDLHQNSGAPNVDCESKEPLTHLFRSLSDNTRLSEHF